MPVCVEFSDEQSLGSFCPCDSSSAESQPATRLLKTVHSSNWIHNLSIIKAVTPPRRALNWDTTTTPAWFLLSLPGQVLVSRHRRWGKVAFSALFWGQEVCHSENRGLVGNKAFSLCHSFCLEVLRHPGHAVPNLSAMSYLQTRLASSTCSESLPRILKHLWRTGDRFKLAVTSSVYLWGF